MRAFGVICECNPLHDGHRYLLRQARAHGADAVVCVMSGCFVQRGEAAIFDPSSRARALVDGGADLVLELPFPYAASGAEFFARAGVDILSRIGVEELWFGSECGDLERLWSLARIAESESFRRAYIESTRSSGGTAGTYVALLQEAEKSDAPLMANDLLGIAYLRALLTSDTSMKAHTIARMGSGYAEARLTEGEVPSATALRAMIRQNGVQSVREYLTPVTAELLQEAIDKGRAPAELKCAERLILGRLSMLLGTKTEEIAELSGGLGARLCAAAREAQSFEELLTLGATKKYPTARLQRGILFALTGVNQEDLRKPVAYTRLLAANEKGYAYLASCRKSRRTAVVTRASDYPNTEDALRLRELELAAERLYELCMPCVQHLPSVFAPRKSGGDLEGTKK